MNSDPDFGLNSRLDRLLFRPSLLNYFQHQKQQNLAEINRYFVGYIDNHSLRTRNEILRDFYIFLESANEYKARVEQLINSPESYESVRETTLTFVANLIDSSNEIIDMIMRGNI